MKGFNKIALIGWGLLVVSIASASGNNLWEHFNSVLPSLKERAIIYNQNFPEKYEGFAEQNVRLHAVLDGELKLGALAFPPSTVEGTSTAGWTDDGSNVRLNTAADFVGIGTTNPAEKLTVQNGNFRVSGNISLSGGTITFGGTSGTSTLTVSNSGRLGIGTTTPRATLGIGGDLMISGTTTVGGLVSTSTLTTNLTVSGSATSSFTGDINLPANKCFQVDGSCIGLASTPKAYLLFSSANTSPAVNTNASSTILSIAIPASTLSTGNSISAKIYVRDLTLVDSNILFMEFAYGNATTSFNFLAPNSMGSTIGLLEVVLTADGATNKQNLSALLHTYSSGLSVASNSAVRLASSTAMVIDSTQNQLLNIVFRAYPGSGATFTTNQILVYVFKL